MEKKKQHPPRPRNNTHLSRLPVTSHHLSDPNTKLLKCLEHVALADAIARVHRTRVDQFDFTISGDFIQSDVVLVGHVAEEGEDHEAREEAR